MAPLGDAVCLIDSNQPDVDVGENLADGSDKAFRGHVHELVFAGPERRNASTAFFPLDTRVDERCADARFNGSIHLILHEGDKWRHHQSCSSGEPG